MRREWRRYLAIAFAAPLMAGQLADAIAQENAPMHSPASGQRNTASSGDFAIMQIATTDPKGLLADWLNPAPGVQIKASSQTVRDKPIYIFLIFKGCRPDASGNCNLTADFNTFDSRGRPYDKRVATPIWVDHPPAPGNNLQLSNASLRLVIHDKDPLGAYRVQASVTDHIAGVTLQTEQTLTVKAD
jgi:hypothetical protein